MQHIALLAQPCVRALPANPDRQKKAAQESGFPFLIVLSDSGGLSYAPDETDTDQAQAQQCEGARFRNGLAGERDARLGVCPGAASIRVVTASASDAEVAIASQCQSIKTRIKNIDAGQGKTVQQPVVIDVPDCRGWRDTVVIDGVHRQEIIGADSAKATESTRLAY